MTGRAEVPEPRYTPHRAGIFLRLLSSSERLGYAE